MEKYFKYIVGGALLLVVSLVGVGVWAWTTPEARAGRRQERADAYLLQKDFPRAIEELKSSLRIKPDRNTQFILATTLMRAGRRDEAMAVMQDLAKENDRIGNVARKSLLKMQANPDLGVDKAAIAK